MSYSSELPIRVRRDSDGRLLEVLIHENWFAPLNKLYKYIDLIAFGPAEVEQLPADLREAGELFQWLTVELGTIGWGISVGIIELIILAVEAGVELTEFVYKTVAGRRYGYSRYGHINSRNIHRRVQPK
jgi:queuine/archaeosine tRNA-ribosyltransferase